MHCAKQNQRLLLMCYWWQLMLCTNVPAALNWVGMTVSSICFLAPRKPLCHSLSGRSPSLCCKHWSQKNTHWVLDLASTLTNLSKYLSPQPEQAFELVWFPSKASGYNTRNHWRKLQQRIWCLWVRGSKLTKITQKSIRGKRTKASRQGNAVFAQADIDALSVNPCKRWQNPLCVKVSCK